MWEDEIVTNVWRNKIMTDQKPYLSMLLRTMILGTTSLLTSMMYQMMWTVTRHTLMRGETS